MKGKKIFKFRRAVSILIIVSFVLGDLLPVREVFAFNKKALDNLGGLNHYNSIVFGNHKATKADTEGAIAVQGNFTVNEAYSVPAAATGAPNIMGSTYVENNSPSVLIGKDYILNGNLDVLANTIVVSNEETKNKLSRIPSHTKPGEYVDCEIRPISEINDTFAYMRGIIDNVSNQSKGYKTNVIDDNTKVDLYVPGNISQDGYIGEKDGTWGFGKDINTNNIFISSGLNEGKESIIINSAKIPAVNNNDFVVAYSDAKNIKFTTSGIEYLGQGIESGDVHYGVVDTGKPGNKTLEMLAKKVIWIFPNATKVEVAGKGIVGSLIAPNAFVDTKGGSVNGQLIAGSLNQFGGFESHNYFFNWDGFLKLAKGSVEFNKVGEDKKSLEGAEFGLFQKDNDILIEKAVSGKDGRVSFTNIDAGEYYVKEIKAPEGYELSDEIYNVIIEDGKATKIDLKDIVNKEIKGSALLYKVNDQNGPLEGAKFGVYRENREKVSEVTSDKDGKVEINNLDAGRYYVQEISAPDGYEVDRNTKYEFEIVRGVKEPVIIKSDAVINVFKGGAAMLLKVHDGNEALEGAEFGLYKEDGDELINKITSGDDGVIKVDGLTAGKYYFKELKAPEGYKIDENKYPFEIKIGITTVVNSGRSVNTFDNGSVKFKKVDTSGNMLEGAIFELYKDINGTWEKQSETYTSNKDGIVEVKGLESGKYYFKEIEAPNGYLLSDKEHHFEIVRGVNTTVDIGNIENVFINGSAKLEKVDEDNKFLKGALFGIYDSNDKLISEVESDDNGIVLVTGLKPGEYYFKEIKAPEGYIISDTVYKFTITSGDIVTVNAGKSTNIFNDGSAKLLKVDEDGNTLEGAEFSLYKNVNGTWEKQEGIYTSNEEGIVVVNELKFGEYYLQEIKAPTGYELSTDKYEFKVEIGNITTINVGEAINNFARSRVKLKKVDSESKVTLAGAIFKLTNLDNNEVIKEAIETGIDGVLEVSELKPGKYRFEEIKAPNGYIQTIVPIDFEIKKGEESQTIELIAENSFLKLANVQFTKVDYENGNLLEGAEFKLYKEINGEFTELDKVYTSNSMGVVIANELEAGKYYFKETKAPNGYLLNGEIIQFEVKGTEGEIILLDNFKNKAEKGSFILEKQGEDNEPLKGAIFELYKEVNGEWIKGEETYTSNKEGKVVIEGLLIGNYKLKEVKAPDGYELSNKEILFTIESGKTTKPVQEVFKNVLKRYSIELEKIDAESKELLSGAEFELRNLDGNVIDKGVVSNGTLKFNGLLPGDYEIYEVKAPEGYNKLADPIRITIDLENSEVTINKTVGNYKIKGEVLLTKKDDVTGNYLEGAKFNIYKEDGTLIKENQVTNIDGELIVKDLEIGKYYIEEVDAPDGYGKLEGKINFEITKDKERIEINDVINERLESGSVQLKKVDSHNKNGLRGAKFKLYRKDDSKFIGEFISDKDGIIIVEGLTFGDYYFIESEAPEGYELSSEKLEFTIEKGNTKTLNLGNIENEIKKGSVILVKEDSETKEVLKDAEFELYEKETGIKIGGLYKTDNNGEIKVSSLRPGKYYFKEVKAPFGYEISNKEINFEIVGGNIVEDVLVTASNDIILGSVTLEKEDSETGELLQGAEFELYYKNLDGNMKIGEIYVTDKDGKININGLKPGEYYFKEVKAPIGYDILEEVITFQIVKGDKAHNLVMRVGNKAEKYDVTLNKVDSDNNNISLNGAIFELRGDGYNTTVHEVSTDGKITVSGLKPGKYSFHEIKAPDGYIQSVVPIEFEIIKGQQTKHIELTAKNSKLKEGTVQLKKVDEEGNGLEGAMFTLYNEFDEELGTYESRKNGLVRVEGLEVGKYYFVETKAPNGYEPSRSKIEFEIKGISSDTILLGDIINIIKKGSVKLVKTDFDNKELLKDAVFELINSDGKLIGKYTTNNNGEIIVNDLKPGEYKFIEIKAPEGYETSKREYKFKIEIGDNVPVITIEATNKKAEVGSVQFMKVDDYTGEGLSEVIFELFTADGKKLSEHTSNEKGVVSADGLVFGDYYFKEKSPQFGYNTSDEKIEFSIVKGDKETVKLDNVNNEIIKGEVNLIKEDSETAKNLSGAKFELFEKDGKSKGIFITDGEGKIAVTHLRPGDYYFIEKEAPEGYEILDEKIEFTILKGDKTDLQVRKVKNDIIKGNVKLIKKDSENSNLLEGAKFSLYDSENNYIGTYTTNKNGEISVNNLRPGDYKFIESEAPDGYELSTKEYTFTIQLGKTETVILEAYNEKIETEIPEPYLGGVKLLKTDSNDETVLKGAEFELKDSEGRVLSTHITDDNGLIEINELNVGKYSLVEIKSPDGYELNSTPIEFEISSSDINKIKELEFENVKIKVPDPEVITGEVIIRKYDVDSKELLTGAIFELLDSNKELISSHVTDENGEIKVNNLEPGTYYFKEVKAPEGYELDDTLYKFIIQGNERGEDLVLKIDNKKVEKPVELGSVVLKKIDSETGESLSGAKFELKDEYGRLVGTYDVNDSGILLVNGLPVGKYSFHEIKAPNGYIQSIIPIEFEIKSGETEKPIQLLFENSLIKTIGSVELLKIDDTTNETLKNAIFGLYGEDKNLINEFETDSNGKIRVDELEVGKYYFKELKAPDGYELSDNLYEFEIVLGNSEVIKLKAVNKKIKLPEPELGGVKLLKTDSETGAKLIGAEFELKDSSGKLLGKYVTNSDGVIEINDLAIGKYVLIEVKAPEGYELNSTHLNFEIGVEDVNAIKELEFKNIKIEVPEKPEYILGSVTLKKYDESKKELLEGALFELLDENKNVIRTCVTDENGEIKIDNLKNGIYYFKEIKAPNGYELDDTLHRFVIVQSEEEKVVLIEVVNKKIDKPVELGGISLKKVDSETLMPLSGAIFDLKNSNDEVIGSYEVGIDGILNISGLNIGKYTLVETKAPEGYIQSIKPLEFEIVEGQTSSPLELIFKNSKLEEEPEVPEVPGDSDSAIIEKEDKPQKSEKDKIPATGRSGSSSVVGIFSLLAGIALIFGKRKF